MINILNTISLLRFIASFLLFDLAVVCSSSKDEESNILRFFMIGDWGKQSSSNARSLRSLKGSKTFYQENIAQAMSNYSSKQSRPCFIIALGDNFYDNGVVSSNDSRWYSVWESVYHGAYPILAVPWYPVLGNHDYGYGDTGVHAQIKGPDSSVVSQSWLWDMPATNYSKSFVFGNNITLTVVFIDTTTLAPSMNKCCNENGGVAFDEQYARIDDQLGHINKMLMEAEKISTWIVVAGHYPIYSCGEHLDSAELRVYLEPLLLQYSVQAYISGHDHISEHLSKDGIEHFIAGSGAITDYLYGESSAKLNWYGVGYSAFVSVTATDSCLEFTFVDKEGEEVYSYSLLNPIKFVDSDDSSSNIFESAEPSEITSDSIEPSELSKDAAEEFYGESLLFFVITGGLILSIYVACKYLYPGRLVASHN